MIHNRENIPAGIYSQMIENIPILCVDLVISHNGKVLLVKRKNEPAKNKWCLPGGRIHKNENLEDAARRKAKEEVGIKINNLKKLGFYEFFDKNSHFENVKSGTHTLSVVFLVELKDSSFKIALDHTSSDFKWFDHIEKDSPDYVKEVLIDSGVFN